MIIKYNELGEEIQTELKKNTTIFLRNKKNTFFHFGVPHNQDPFLGFFFVKEKKVFKLLDEIMIPNREITSITIISLFSVKRLFTKENKSFYEVYTILENGNLEYKTNYDKEIYFDFDYREKNNFNDSSEYTIENNTLKVNQNTYSETIYFSIKKGILNQINLNEEKNYSYPKQRGANAKRNIKRIWSCTPQSKEMVFTIGLFKIENNSIKESLKEEKVFLEKKKLNYFKNNLKEINLEEHFSTYQSNRLFFQEFKYENKLFAGHMWFSDAWRRDEMISSKILFYEDEDAFTAKLLQTKFEEVERVGKLRIIAIEGSNSSIDSFFWLCKRTNEYFENCKNKNKKSLLDKNKILPIMYDKIIKIYNKFTQNEKGILILKQGDSWMDTLEEKTLIDVQVGFLSAIQSYNNLSEDKNKIKELNTILSNFKDKIITYYYKNNILYDTIKQDRYSSNIFLVYYLFNELFSKKEWEKIIDKTLPQLLTSWGGISSLNKENNNFQDEYTGENNLSYHNGDSWFFMTYITGIVLYKINPIKYQKEIKNILNIAKRETLFQGTLGGQSEISSAKEFKSEGCLLQLWSSALYIDFFETIFKK